jgi:hypothetical protein
MDVFIIRENIVVFLLHSYGFGSISLCLDSVSGFLKLIDTFLVLLESLFGNSEFSSTFIIEVGLLIGIIEGLEVVEDTICIFIESLSFLEDSFVSLNGISDVF